MGKEIRDIEQQKYDPALFINELKQQIMQIVHQVLSDNSNRQVVLSTPNEQQKKETKKIIRRAKKKDNTTQTSEEATPKSVEPITGSVCPLCQQGIIIKGKTAYGCSNWKQGCTYRVPFADK